MLILDEKGMTDMKIGFIGAGNMAAAIVKGLVGAGIIEPKNISVYDVDKDRSKALSKEYGVAVSRGEGSLAGDCDVVVLAVKPYVLDTLLPKISRALEKKNPLVVSIAVGKTLRYIEDLLSYSPALVRVMPNINAKVGGAMSAICSNDRVSAEQLESVKEIFGCVGGVAELDESQFSTFAAVAASSPAFTYMYIDALARSGVKNGMNKAQALKIAAQSVMGSAKMILESDEHPWALVDQVCSPGGTTIEGVASLQNDAFEASVLNAIDAVIAKDKKI